MKLITILIMQQLISCKNNEYAYEQVSKAQEAQKPLEPLEPLNPNVEIVLNSVEAEYLIITEDHNQY